MNVHKNAPLTPKGREAMVRSVIEGGQSKAGAAYQFNTTPKTVAKWVGRFRAEGVEGLRDRSYGLFHCQAKPRRPHVRLLRLCAASATPASKLLRKSVYLWPRVSRVMRRLGLNRIRDLEPAEPVRRYERSAPGEITHIDIKKLGRFERITR